MLSVNTHWTDCTEKPRPDIDQYDTMLWLMVFIGIGWFVLLLCYLVLGCWLRF